MSDQPRDDRSADVADLIARIADDCEPVTAADFDRLLAKDEDWQRLHASLLAAAWEAWWQECCRLGAAADLRRDPDA